MDIGSLVATCVEYWMLISVWACVIGYAYFWRKSARLGRELATANEQLKTANEQIAFMRTLVGKE